MILDGNSRVNKPKVYGTMEEMKLAEALSMLQERYRLLFDKNNEAEEELEKLKKQNEILKECVEFYADRMSYSLDDYAGVSGEMRSRVVLYGDSTEVNDVSSFAGKRARDALKMVGEL